MISSSEYNGGMVVWSWRWQVFMQSIKFLNHPLHRIDINDPSAIKIINTPLPFCICYFS